jgi:hypothetical protein
MSYREASGMSKRPSSIRRFLLGSKTAGFLTLHETEKAGFTGSFLITDLKGIPIEFRCTHPLKPDAVQRSLYGEALQSYIGVEICGKPLINAVKKKPKLLFVDKPFLLKLEDHAPCPTFFVQEIDEEDAGANPTRFDSAYHVEVIESRYNGFPPLELVTKGEVKPKTRELIEQLYYEVNIVESFERMKNAVGSLNQITSRVKSVER